MQWVNVQSDACTLDFIYNDYDGEPITIYGGAQPFVLSEFNTDNDLFKPIRPQQATIQVLASISGLDLEDFLTDNDTDITVRFGFSTFSQYWQGILSQEDIEETWIAQNHILVLRADDGFGRLKTTPLTDTDGSLLSGPYTPFQYVQYAANDVIGTFLYSRIYNNLYHDSMTYGSNQTGFDQCTIDARTFEQNTNVFDNAYDVIDKINRAWSQTLFQWNNVWVFLRIPELFRSGNLIGFDTNRPTIGNRSARNQRYDINVAVDGEVKPIMPEMLKTIQKPSKNTTLTFDWKTHDQLICNQSFQSGSFVQSGTKTETDGAGNSISINYDEYTVNQWELYQYGSEGTVSNSAPYGRRSEYNVQGLRNNYFYIGGSAVPIPPGNIDAQNTEAFSCRFYVKWQDIIKFSFNYRTSTEFSPNSNLLAIARILLKNGTDTYYHQYSDDTWQELTPSSTLTNIYTNFPAGKNSKEWETKTFETKQVPFDGWIEVYLLNAFQLSAYTPSNVPNNLESQFSDLTIEIINSISIQRNRIIVGDYDRYTIDKQVVNNYNNTIYLDDAQTQNHKGALLENDGITLTNDAWYRRTDFNGDNSTAERLTFKRHNAMSNWYMNRSYKTKLDVNLFGLKWTANSVSYPIGIINTIKFPDDAPTKTFAITNMSDVDFMNCTWRASLIEIYDSSVTDNEPGDNDVHSYDYIYES